MGAPTHEGLEHEKELQAEWEKSTKLMEPFYGDKEGRTPETIAAATREHLAQMLTREHFQKTGETHMVCIDEGCACTNSVEDLIALAGSGIAISEHYNEALQTAVALAKDMGIEVITSHAGCGAGKLAFSKLPEEAQRHYEQLFADLGIEEGKGTKYLSASDLYAADFAKGLATEAGLKYDHIDKDRMVRPKTMHTARMIFVDMTGHMQPQKIEDLPRSFLISGAYLEEDYRNLELGVAINIALGDHGFGDKFSKEEPLLVVLLGVEGDDALGKHQESIEQLLEKKFGSKPVQMVAHTVSQELID